MVSLQVLLGGQVHLLEEYRSYRIRLSSHLRTLPWYLRTPKAILECLNFKFLNISNVCVWVIIYFPKIFIYIILNDPYNSSHSVTGIHFYPTLSTFLHYWNYTICLMSHQIRVSHIFVCRFVVLSTISVAQYTITQLITFIF